MKKKFDYSQRPKGRAYNAEPYRLPREQWPLALQNEFSAYETWRTDSFVLGRSWQRRQRPTTFAKSVIEYESYFGYLVNEHGRSAHSLQLADIHNLDLLRAYAVWHARERTNGPSRFIEKTIGDFLAVARHYLSADEDSLTNMTKLKAEMKPEKARDKRERWVSLATLEAIGCAERPNANGRRPASSVLTALDAQRSLLIRLLVRRPLRNRNIREMQLRRNLYREAAGWVIEFRGNELKVGRREGRESVYRTSFPGNLVEQLEEFLGKWRPILNADDRDLVFLSLRGTPISQGALNEQIRKAVYEYTGRATNIHLFRDIWATEYITDTQNFSVAATMLGDTLETVLRHYAHLRTHDASNQADAFITRILDDSNLHGVE